jgi:hypothetical protein
MHRNSGRDALPVETNGNHRPQPLHAQRVAHGASGVEAASEHGREDFSMNMSVEEREA